MSITSGSDERMAGSDERMAGSDVDSPSIDDANSGGSGKGQLKKGPWTSTEDAILIDYVTKNGEGNWNAVQKHSGLARCGKSCRLRWTNHLRPDLKKGAFTPDEERRIIELHAKMGNKWARMATELPGRTDNEIKNFWNTRIKRLQRSGLPIYPPDICLQASNENQQTNSTSTLPSANVHQPDFLPANDFKIPEFKGLELNNPTCLPLSFLDIPHGGLLDVSPGNLGMISNSSNPNGPFLSTAQPPKRLRPSEPLIPGTNVVGMGNTFVGGSQFDSSMQIAQSFSPSSLLHDSDAVLNGNPSSEPARAMKTELPSLQTEPGHWGPSSPPFQSFEPVDVLIQTPPTGNDKPTQNSGLLDTVLYESEAMHNPTSNGYVRTSCPVDVMAQAVYDLHQTDWDAYDDELSSLCPSTSSVFSTSTPLSGNSFDELHSASNFPGYANEEANMGSMLYDHKVEMSFSGPDFLLTSNHFTPVEYPSNLDNDHFMLKDAIAAFLVDDLSKENDMGANANLSGQGHGHENTMPMV